MSKMQSFTASAVDQCTPVVIVTISCTCTWANHYLHQSDDFVCNFNCRKFEDWCLCICLLSFDAVKDCSCWLEILLPLHDSNSNHQGKKELLYWEDRLFFIQHHWHTFTLNARFCCEFYFGTMPLPPWVLADIDTYRHTYKQTDKQTEI